MRLGKGGKAIKPALNEKMTKLFEASRFVCCELNNKNNINKGTKKFPEGTEHC